MESALKDKDIEIKRIVDYLLDKYNDKILIKDFWDGDLCAIGLSDNSEKYLIYISTFGLLIDRFNVILENIQNIKGDSEIVGEFNDITLDILEKIMVDHLRIK